MGLSFDLVLPALAAVVVLAAAIPPAIGLILCLTGALGAERRNLRKTAEAFRSVADAAADIETCERENLLKLDEAAEGGDIFPPAAGSAWRRMRRQLDAGFGGGGIPEGRFFFPYESLPGVGSEGARRDWLWRLFPVLGVLCLLLPCLVGGLFWDALPFSLLAGGVALSLLSLCFLASALFGRLTDTRARNAHERFVLTFDRVLPVMRGEAALSFDVSEKERASRETLERNIIEQIRGLADGGLLPLFRDSIETALREHLTPAVQEVGRMIDAHLAEALAKQDCGMTSMVADFSDRLGQDTEARITALAEGIGRVRENLLDLNGRLDDHTRLLAESSERALRKQEERMEQISRLFADTLIESLREQSATLEKNAGELSGVLQVGTVGLNEELSRVRDLMGETNSRFSEAQERLAALLAEHQQMLVQSEETLARSGELQNQAIQEIHSQQERFLDNHEGLSRQLQSFGEIIGAFSGQIERFNGDAFHLITETGEAQKKLAESVASSQEKLSLVAAETTGQYAKMHEQLAGTMDQLTGQINEAMSQAGREIARGIKEVTADNAEAIEHLAEQAKTFRADYDACLSGMEAFTGKMLDDMDYQVKMVIQRISEDVGAMLRENTTANAEILSAYKDNTTDLLQSFEEQARSIGLYAKEINLDISNLSDSLKTSVDEFGTKIREGVQFTIGEFDRGLGELTDRMANTVESISDAVEALPAALNRK